MKALAFADVHLGAGSRFGRVPAERLADQERILETIVDIAIERDAQLVLCAGDVFDGPHVHPEQYEAFRRPMQRLLDNARIVGISGNGRHDSAMRETNALEVVGDLFDPLMTRPGIVEVGGLKIGCLPWASIGNLAALNGGGQRDLLHDDAAALVLDIARGLYADGARILLGHWSVSGAATPTGIPTDQFREVVLDTRELEEIGFDAIVLGHIHRAQIVSPGPLAADENGSHFVRDGRPIFYTGSTQVCDWGEAGCKHGVWLFDTDDPGGTLEFVEIADRPFVSLDWDHDDDPDVYREVLAGDFSMSHLIPGAIVRVKYRASEEEARRVDHAQITAALYEAGAHVVTGIVPEIVRESRARVDGVDEDLAPMAALDAWLLAERLDDPLRQGMRNLLGSYLEAVA